MENKPFISVIVATLNAEGSIRNLLRSLVIQGFKDFELIVADSNSTDKTLEILKRYSDKFAIKVTSSADTGIFDAWNKGVKLASGDWLLFLNAGDELFNGIVLEEMANIAKELPASTEFIAAQRMLVSELDGEVLQKPYRDICSELPYFKRKPAFSAMLVRAHVPVNTPFDPAYKYAGAYDFLTKTVKEDNVLTVGLIIVRTQKLGVSIRFFKRYDVVKEVIEIMKARGYSHSGFMYKRLLVKSWILSTLAKTFGEENMYRPIRLFRK